MKNIPEKIYLQIGDECDSEDFNELSEVSCCKDKIYDNDIEYTLQNQMDNITEKEIEKLSEEWFQTADKKNIIFDLGWMKIFEAGHKAALQNKVSDISAVDIFKKHFPNITSSLEWHFKEIIAAMEEYASIVNERKDNAGSCETSNEVLNEVLGIAVKAHLFQQLNQMDDFIEEIEKFKNFEIRKK